MTDAEVTALLERTGALLSGHFQLSSGLHGDRYIQCALALAHPDVAAAFGSAVAAKFGDPRPELVVGPALGGVIIAHEVGRALGVPVFFTERQEGKMALRRGFAVRPGQKVAMVEDVVTTGGSVLEAAEVMRAAGADVLGFGCIVDRSDGTSKLGPGLRSLMRLSLPSWKPAECPLCAKGLSAVKPGSRPVAV